MWKLKIQIKAEFLFLMWPISVDIISEFDVLSFESSMKCFCLASFDRKLLSLDPQARVWGIGKYRHRSTINDAVRADQANSLQQSAGRAVSHLTSPHPTPLCSSDGPPHSFVCIVLFLGWLARCSMRSCYLLSNSAYISTLHCGGV